MSERELREVLGAATSDMKEAAICAFVLARKYQQRQEESMARHFADKCIELLRKCPANTLEQCTHPYITVGGVLIPGIFHCPANTLEQCTHPYITVGGVLIPGIFHEGTVRRELAALNL